MTFNLSTFDVEKFDKILSRGLSSGIGNRNGQMCIEAAICDTLGIPEGDDPGCVCESVRQYKMALNDSSWSSSHDRAKALRDLGLAQLGSFGVVKDDDFNELILKKTIGILVPKLFRKLFSENEILMSAVLRCEEEQLILSVIELHYKCRNILYDFMSSSSGHSMSSYFWFELLRFVDKGLENLYSSPTVSVCRFHSIRSVWFSETANQASFINHYKDNDYGYKGEENSYLLLSAQLALEALKELNSPGIALL